MYTVNVWTRSILAILGVITSKRTGGFGPRKKKHVFIINLAHSIDIQPLSIEKIKHLRPARCISHVRAHSVVGHLRLGPGGPFYDLLGDVPAACWVVGPPVRHLLVIPLATKSSAASSEQPQK